MTGNGPGDPAGGGPGALTRVLHEPRPTAPGDGTWIAALPLQSLIHERE
jgi:hypothetical protein